MVKQAPPLSAPPWQTLPKPNVLKSGRRMDYTLLSNAPALLSFLKQQWNHLGKTGDKMDAYAFAYVVRKFFIVTTVIRR